MKTQLLIAALVLSSAAHARSMEELTAAGTPEQQGVAIAAELAARNAGYKDMVGVVDMTLSDGAGTEATRNFSLKVLERASATEGDRSLIVFERPADVKGTAVLSHAAGQGGEDEQWLFLPSARRTRRISSSNRTGAFVGSEFTFEDLTGNDGRKYSWKLLGKKACGTGQCLEVEATPNDVNSAYSRRVLTIDGAQLRVLSIDFYDRKAQLLKTLSYDEYAVLNEKFSRAQKWTMKNVQTQKTTIIHFTAMKLGTGLAANDFSPNVLSR